MTMHLIQGISTLNTRKPSFKMTKAKEALWREDFAIFNRELKRQGWPKLDWEQYVDMRLGKTKVSKPAFKPLTIGIMHPRYEDSTVIASLNSTVGNTNRKEPLMYSGTLVKGICTMHKSNAVPVINEEQMKDISRMRRG